MTYGQVYRAALAAVRGRGPRLKEISWFKRNWKDIRHDED